MLQKVTINFFRVIDGNIFPQTEDVLVDAPDGDTAAFLARQEHGPRILAAGALCETDEHGGRKIRMAITGIEPPSAADIARLMPKPAPEGARFIAVERDVVAMAGGPPKGPSPDWKFTNFGTDIVAVNGADAPRNKGGRPKGSKNKPKGEADAA